MESRWEILKSQKSSKYKENLYTLHFLQQLLISARFVSPLCVFVHIVSFLMSRLKGSCRHHDISILNTQHTSPKNKDTLPPNHNNIMAPKTLSNHSIILSNSQAIFKFPSYLNIFYSFVFTKSGCNLFLKGQDSKYFRFACHDFSVAVSQLCSTKAAIDNRSANKHDCVPIKFYLLE